MGPGAKSNRGGSLHIESTHYQEVVPTAERKSFRRQATKPKDIYYSRVSTAEAFGWLAWIFAFVFSISSCLHSQGVSKG